jgi:hypothetical protein
LDFAAVLEIAGFFAARLARTGFFRIAVPKMKTPGRVSPGACFRCDEMRKAFDQTAQAQFRGVPHLFAFLKNRSPLVHATDTFGVHFPASQCAPRLGQNRHAIPFTATSLSRR